MTMAQDCEISDSQCRIAVAGALKVERVIYGSVHRSSRRTLEVELHMANRRDGTETRATRSLSSRDTSDAAFARVATELLAELRGEPTEHEEAAPGPTPVATVAPMNSSIPTIVCCRECRCGEWRPRSCETRCFSWPGSSTKPASDRRTRCRCCRTAWCSQASDAASTSSSFASTRLRCSKVLTCRL